MVQDRQHHRLQHHGVLEAALDAQHGGVGEVQLALLVAVHVAGEAVLGEVLEGLLLQHSGASEVAQVRLIEAEVGDRVEDATGAGERAVAAALGQGTGEHLEDAAARCGARLTGGLQHRELVEIGE